MIVQSIADVHKVVEKASALSRIGYDVETAGGTRFEKGARICGYAVGFSSKENDGVYIPVRHAKATGQAQLLDELDPCENLPVAEVSAILKPILEANRPLKVGCNLKFDLRAGRRDGIELKAIIDVQQGIRVALPNVPRVEGESKRFGLKSLRQAVLHQTVEKRDELDAWLTSHGLDWTCVHMAPISLVGQYAVMDVTTPLALHDVLLKIIEKDNKYQIAHKRDPKRRGFGFLWQVENMLVPVLADMEDAGFPVDVAYFEDLKQKLSAEADAIAERIGTMTGYPQLDPRSNQQLAVVLYDHLGIPCMKRTEKGGRSVDGDALTLAEAKTKNPVLSLIQGMRLKDKFVGTYIDGKKGKSILENTTDGRVYGSIRADGAGTGRFSALRPNLTNMPNTADPGGLIRHGFVTDGPDWRLVSADLAQVEPRLLAHYSGAQSLIDAFIQGRDVYRQMAIDCGLAECPGDVDKKLRRKMKSFVLGLNYRMGAKLLAQRLTMETGENVTERQARGMMDNYFDRVPEVKRFFNQSDAAVARVGYAVTILGRRRPLPPGKEHVGVNTRIQGSAADLFKVGVVRCHNALRGKKTYGIVPIHDDFLSMNHRSEADVILTLVDCLTQLDGLVALRVPLEADVTIYDDTWAKGREFKVMEILRDELDRAESVVLDARTKAGLQSLSPERVLEIETRAAERWAEKGEDLCDDLVDDRIAIKQEFWQRGKPAAPFAEKIKTWRDREVSLASEIAERG